ncbi:MAG: DUF1992 domain-containing protein [Syntrophomonadaceae bacterium]|nr:DUF1992 domain-containing protein [Syntrophomonadaceae bacterium]
MADRPIEEEIMLKAQQSRRLAKYMSSTEELVEEQIRKARERGDFDNLEGTGKPIDLSENPYEPAELRMAFRILKNNDFTPYWIQLGHDIDAETVKIRKEVEEFKRYSVSFMGEKHTAVIMERFGKRKSVFYLEKKKQLEKLKKKILDYNLHCPTFRLGRANIDVNEEMVAIMHQIEKVIEEARTLKSE